MRNLLLLLTLLLIACVPEPKDNRAEKSFFLRAYLIADKPVKEIQLLRVAEYGFYTPDSTTDYEWTDVYVTDAEITLFHNGERIPLEADSANWYRFYVSDHVVEPGGHYALEAVIFDTVSGETVTLTAETTVPEHDTSIVLDTNTIWLSDSLVQNHFWDMYREPGNYPHVTMTFGNPAHYQLIEYTPMASNIFPGISKPAFIERLPSKQDSLIISPVHLSGYKYYGQFRMVVHHLNDEYADLYVHSGPQSDAWTYGDTKLVPEGISNVSNGGGIFTGITSDTLNLYLKKEY